jgi:hypothetical protein
MTDRTSSAWHLGQAGPLSAGKPSVPLGLEVDRSSDAVIDNVDDIPRAARASSGGGMRR